MDSLIVPWLLSALSVVGLIGCVEYNRRTGYKKIRAGEAPSDDAMLWIGATKQSLTQLPASKLRDIAMAEESTQQLIRLYKAYNSPASEPVPVPADVQGEYALAHK